MSSRKTSSNCSSERRMAHTSFSFKMFGSENQVSSTTTSGVRGFPLYKTVATEDVKTTRFTDVDFAHDLTTLRVPVSAGSINCF